MDIRQKRIYKVTITGSIVNLGLVLFKLAAGILGRSTAMIADGIHSLSDLATDFVVIFFTHVSGKPRDKKHEYGHGKFETLATLIVGFVLLIVGAGIAQEGISRILIVIRGGTLERPGMVALAAALVSVVSKEILFRYTVREGRAVKSDVVVANAWHHRSDAFSSIGTAVGIGGAIFLGPKWAVLDPVAALVVSALILYMAVALMKPALNELLERSLPEEVEAQIINTALSEEGVSDPHNLRTRKIGSGYAIELHVRMDPDTPLGEAHKTATAIEQKLIDRFGQQTHVIIHMEPEGFKH